MPVQVNTFGTHPMSEINAMMEKAMVTKYSATISRLSNASLWMAVRGKVFGIRH